MCLNEVKSETVDDYRSDKKSPNVVSGISG